MYCRNRIEAVGEPDGHFRSGRVTLVRIEVRAVRVEDARRAGRARVRSVVAILMCEREAEIWL